MQVYVALTLFGVDFMSSISEQFQVISGGLTPLVIFR